MEMFAILNRITLIDSIKVLKKKLDEPFYEKDYKNRAMWELKCMEKYLINKLK